MDLASGKTAAELLATYTGLGIQDVGRKSASVLRTTWGVVCTCCKVITQPFLYPVACIKDLIRALCKKSVYDHWAVLLLVYNIFL